MLASSLLAANEALLTSNVTGNNRLRMLALFGSGATSDLSPLSGANRKWDFGATRTAVDPNETWTPWKEGYSTLPGRAGTSNVFSAAYA